MSEYGKLRVSLQIPDDMNSDDIIAFATELAKTVAKYGITCILQSDDPRGILASITHLADKRNGIQRQ